MNGIPLTLLRINLTTGETRSQEIGEETAKKYMGGSGLGAKILLEELGSGVDPFGDENRLLFMTGPLTATAVPSSSRFTVAGKSPLTGIWGEANAGGNWGRQLRNTGYDGIVVEGRSNKPVYLWIHDREVVIRDAAHLWGTDIFETHDQIQRETHPDAGVVCIGKAGENRVLMASIVSDGRHARAAARCGLGAVAGSKGLKAIAVRGEGGPLVREAGKLSASVKAMMPTFLEQAKRMSQTGTPWLVVNQERLGSYPIKNWSQDRWQEGALKTGWEEMEKTIFTRRFRCGGCPVGCGRTVQVREGPYRGREQGGPEYETLAMLGSNCLIDDLPAIQKAHELCNTYGMDTIEVGGVIAFAMECYDRGLITKKDTGGLDLTWGNARSVIALIKLIAERDGFGKVLAGGLLPAAAEIGQGSEKYVIHTKGLGFPAHDPRGYNSVGLAFATSNRGACHLQGYTNVFERTVTMPELGIHEIPDRFSKEGKGELVARLQDLMCLFDSAAICKFTLFGGVRVSHLVEWLNLVTGWDMNAETLMKTGERIFNAKRLFNTREGIRRADDALPERILTAPKKEGPAKGNIPPLEKMLQEYYRFRGWDRDGVPTKEKLEDLGMDFPQQALDSSI